MPLISAFYGILVRMYFFDTDQHHMPHIHVQYQGAQAQFAIETAELLAGELPRAQTRLIQAWIELHRDELTAAWRMASQGFRPGRIAPLR
jgi:pyruvate dehydrogenase complex dehydrogenase (E1) component